MLGWTSRDGKAADEKKQAEMARKRGFWWFAPRKPAG